MNDPPDERALAIYEARARHHASTLTLLDETLVGPDRPKNVELLARVLKLREDARRGLRLMEALAATWHRDMAERQNRSHRREQEIRNRYNQFNR